MDSNLGVEALGYRVLVRAPFIEEKTKSGLYLPVDSTEEVTRKSAVGKVVAIGPSAFKGEAEYFKVNVGDWIVYSKYEREPIEKKIDGQTVLFYFINDDRILAKIDENIVSELTHGGK